MNLLKVLALALFSLNAFADGRIKDIDIFSDAQISFSKTANIATHTFLGNSTGSTGHAAPMSVATAAGLLGVPATAFNLSYTPTVGGNWSVVPTNVGDALDTLAAKPTESPLTFNAPLSRTSNAISIPVSTNSVDGYLSSSDHTAFAAKEPAITSGTTLQYWRGDKSFQTLNTLAVPELTNLYYTQARFDTAFAAKSTTDLVEGTNLYFTPARAIGAPLTGYTSGAGTVSSSDSILQAIQKLNGNTSAISASAITSATGDITGTGPGATLMTLATVNSTPGTYGDASHTTTFTDNGKGLITASSQQSIQIAESQVTSLVSDLAGKQPTGSYAVTTNNLSDLSSASTARTNLGLGSFALKNSLVSGDIPNNAANTSGNAATATAFDHTPTTCSAGNYPLGVDAGGNAVSCTAASSGSVTSVSGTAPVVSSGGATPTISMHIADATHDGYLGSTDFNAFEAVIGAPASIGTFGSSPNNFGASLASNVLTLQPADATHPGGLTTGAQTIAGAKTFSSTIVGSVSGNAATVTTNANLTGPITSVGNATSVASQTGTGSTFVMNTSPTLVTPALGTPSSATLTNATGLPISTGVSGLGTGVATFLATPSSANLASALTDETGTGAAVFSNSPTLVTPALGTPSALVGTNITGTASGLTAGNVTTNANLTGPITSVGNATSVASQTGTGSTFVMNTSPTLVTPTLGVALGTSWNGVTLNAGGGSGSLVLAPSKSVAFNNSVAFNGTDGITVGFGTGNAANALFSLTPAADKIPYFTGTTTAGLITIGSGLSFSGGTLSASGSASPLTTKGDLYVHSTVDTRLPIGADTFVLTADSTATTGMKWAASSGGGTAIVGTGNGQARFELGGAVVPFTAISGPHYQTTTLTLSNVLMSALNSGTSGSTTIQINQYRSGALQDSATASLASSSGNPNGGSSALSHSLSLLAGDVVTVDVTVAASGASDLGVEWEVSPTIVSSGTPNALSSFRVDGAVIPFTTIGTHYQSLAITMSTVSISAGNSGSSGSTTIQVNQYRSGTLMASATASLPSASSATSGAVVNLSSSLSILAGDVLTVDVNSAATGASDLTVELDTPSAATIATTAAGANARFTLSDATVPYTNVDGSMFISAAQVLTTVNMGMLNSGSSGSTTVRFNQWRSGSVINSATASLSSNSGGSNSLAAPLSGSLTLAANDIVSMDLVTPAGGAPSDLSVSFPIAGAAVANSPLQVVTVTGTTYTFSDTDDVVIFNCSAACTATMGPVSTSTLKRRSYVNKGSFQVTFVPNGSDKFNNDSTLTLGVDTVNWPSFTGIPDGSTTWVIAN